MLEIASNPTCVYSAVPSRGSTQTVSWSRVAAERAGGQEMFGGCLVLLQTCSIFIHDTQYALPGGQEMLEAASLLELETIQSAGTPLRSCIAISFNDVMIGNFLFNDITLVKFSPAPPPLQLLSVQGTDEPRKQQCRAGQI